jgi:hypothetical protein
MSETVTIEQLLAVAEKDLLISGGVDNWDWYSESLENYEPSENPYVDAVNFVNALSNGGVDNWTWYDESITGLSGYEEYLDGLSDLSTVVSFFEWRENEKLTVVNDVKEEIKVVAEEAVKPEGEAEKSLYEHIVNKFGSDKADEVFVLAKEQGVWKATNFSKEFKAALKVIKEGVENPMEKARQSLINAVIKNGKLDIFLNEITSK